MILKSISVYGSWLFYEGKALPNAVSGTVPNALGAVVVAGEVELPEFLVIDIGAIFIAPPKFTIPPEMVLIYIHFPLSIHFTSLSFFYKVCVCPSGCISNFIKSKKIPENHLLKTAYSFTLVGNIKQ